MATDPTQALLWSVDVTNPGAATSRDKDAATGVVISENNRRTAYNENPDGSDPPPADQDAGDGTWTMLPYDTNQTLLASYMWCFEYRICPPAHSSYADQYAAQMANSEEYKQRYRISTDAQREASLNELAPLPA